MNQDRRALWENSENLRASVRDDLYEWGGAQRGGFPDLDFYKEQPFLKGVLPKPGQARYDVDKVDAITDTFCLWRLGSDYAKPEASKQARRYMRVLKRYYIGQGAVEPMAEAEGVRKRQFYYLLGEAMRQFWTLHY